MRTSRLRMLLGMVLFFFALSVSGVAFAAKVGIGDMPEENSVHVTRSRVVATTDGTPVWDADDEPGNDSGPNNGIVRSFDRVSYDVEVVLTPDSKVAEYDYYGTTRVGFKVVLPYSKTQAGFDLDTMNWCDTTKGYERKVAEEVIDGQPCRVLTCYRLLLPSDNAPSTSPGTYTVTFPCRVYAMVNGETFAPKIYTWVEGSDVDRVAIYGNELGFETTMGDPVTVSSYPHFNVRMQADSYVSVTGNWDFNTGNELADAQNKGIGNVYGRIYAYTAQLELFNPVKAKGFKGLEYPTGPISFDVDVSSVFKLTETTEGPASVSDDVSEDFRPLLFVGGGHNIQTIADNGRTVVQNHNSYNYPVSLSPRNIHQTDGKHGSDWYQCYQGGDWTVSQDGTKIHMVVDNYAIDYEHGFPYGNWGNGATTVGTWYNKYSGLENIGVFSSADLFMIQPYYSLKDGSYILDRYENGVAGSFTMKLTDSNLQAKALSGAELPIVEDNSNQANRGEDTATRGYELRRPGGWNTWVVYTHNDNVGNISEWGSQRPSATATEYGGYGWAHGRDYAVLGTKMRILAGTQVNMSGEMDLLRVADRTFLKIDDKAMSFDPTREIASRTAHGDVRYPESKEHCSYFWVAKSDGTGWTDDAEMLAASMHDEDLVFYDSLEALEADGKVCVGVIAEIIWANNSDAANNWCYMWKTYPVTVTDDFSMIGHVAQANVEAETWTWRSVEPYVAESTGKPATELTWEDYQTWTLANIPSIGEHRALDYVAPWKHANRSQYEKSVYNEEGVWQGGHNTNYNLGDSLLILGETTGVKIEVAQRASGTPREIFDMDYQQRTVDYVVTPSVTRGVEAMTDDSPTDVTLTVTLPKDLTYIPGSFVYGGTYEEHTPAQGTVTGGEPFSPQVSIGDDGSTTLVVRLENVVPSEIGQFHLSATIGTEGEEETDVKNNQTIEATATATSRYSTGTAAAAAGNYSSAAFRISKLRAASLSVRPDPVLNEVNDTVGFIYKLANRALTPARFTGLALLPYNGDVSGSDFNGTYSLASIVVDKEACGGDLSDVSVWATTATDLRSLADIAKADRAVVESSFTQLAFDAATGVATVPASLKGATAIYVVKGSLAPDRTLAFDVRLDTDGNAPDDCYGTILTDFDNKVQARLYIVSRHASGLVWEDSDGDGIREAGEGLISGAHVKLVDAQGNTVKNLRGVSCEMDTGEDGAWRFDDLPAGTYSAVITRTDKFAGYLPSAYMAPGSTSSTNNDAVSRDVSGGFELVIEGIEMPALADMLSSVYGAEHLDSAICPPASITKAPAEQSKTWGVDNNVTFDIECYVPHRYGDAAPDSVSVTDTLHQSLDASGATFTVTRGSTDATASWSVARDGQKLTFTTTDCEGSSATAAAGVFTIHVTAPFKSSWDWNDFEKVTRSGQSVGHFTNNASLSSVKSSKTVDSAESDDVDVYVTGLGRVSVTKTASGNGSAGEKFSFEVSYSGTDAPATDKFTLGSGETWTSEGMAAGIVATVREVGADAYDTTWSSTASTWSDKNHSVSVEGGATVAVNVSNVHKTGVLKLTKVLSGKAGEPDHKFTFTVTLKDPSGNLAKNVTFGGHKFDANGTCQVQVSANAPVTMSELPYGWSYSVSEVADAGYATKASSGTTGTIGDKTTSEASITNERSLGQLRVTKTLEE